MYKLISLNNIETVSTQLHSSINGFLTHIGIQEKAASYLYSALLQPTINPNLHIGEHPDLGRKNEPVPIDYFNVFSPKVSGPVIINDVQTQSFEHQLQTHIINFLIPLKEQENPTPVTQFFITHNKSIYALHSTLTSKVLTSADDYNTPATHTKCASFPLGNGDSILITCMNFETIRTTILEHSSSETNQKKQLAQFSSQLPNK